MRKLLFILALALTLALPANVWASLQIDEGQTRGAAGNVTKFFIGRNARQDTIISADRVVVWDSTSNDGVTVTTTTTSFDGLVAGVTMDSLPGITEDNTAADSSGTSNWGRIRVYGRHANVSWDSGVELHTDGGALNCTTGTRVGTSNVAGTATMMVRGSDDSTATSRRYQDASRDHFGVTLEACSDQNKQIDIFVNRG